MKGTILMSQISRRKFLQASLAGSVGLVAAGLMGPAAVAEHQSIYQPGTYSAAAKGIGDITATVTFSETAITDIVLDLSNETESIGQAAKDAIIDQILTTQGIEIDGVSGATVTVNAVKAAVSDCIAKANRTFVERTAPVAPTAEKAAVPAWTEMNPQDESYDTCTTDFSAIFSPIKVGHMTLRNRIVKASAGSDTMKSNGGSAAGMPQDAMDYYGMIADGGAALVLCETGCVSPYSMSPSGKKDPEKFAWGIEQVKKLTDRIHRGGAYAGVQFGIGSPVGENDPRNDSIEDIEEMIRQYGECALRLKQAGMDCVELKGATNDLLNAYCSRRGNLREDEYGAQTEENRMRYFVRMVQEVRKTCGDDFSILCLINAVEENDKDLGANDGDILIEEAQNLAKTLVEAGADLIQVRVGTVGMEANCWATDTNFCAYKANGTTGYGTQFDFSQHFQGLYDGAHSGCGAFIPMAREIKKVVSVPVGCASYIDPRTAPDMMNNAIVNGDLDILFMNRPLTVDPELPNKLREGRRDEIAPCTRCFHCHNKAPGALKSDTEKCRVNANTQFAWREGGFEEGYALTPAASPKKVLVIGGGAAGMEAARIAALRGHKVTLVEKNGYLGGMMLYAEQIKGPHERLGDLVKYLSRQQEITGVTVITGKEATVDFVKEQNPDAVIVAVGGARESRYAGPNVIGMDNFMGAQVGENVVILGASLQATDLAQYLIAQGKHVQLVHGKSKDYVADGQSPWVKAYVRAHLYAHGVKAWNDCSIVSVDDKGVTVKLNTTGTEHTIPCDTVIECYDMIPNTALMDAIAAAGYEVHAAAIDNACTIQNAIHEGHKAARYL